MSHPGAYLPEDKDALEEALERPEKGRGTLAAIHLLTRAKALFKPRRKSVSLDSD